MNFGKIVKQKREEAGLCQGRFADHFGVSQGTISRIESGKVIAGRNVREKMSRLLRINLQIMSVNKKIKK